MGRFGKWLNKISFKLDDDTEIKLNPTMNDIHELMSVQGTSKDGMTKDALEKQSNIYLGMLKRSYPDEPVEELEAVLSKSYVSFMKEFTIALGWAKRSQFEAEEDKLKKKMSEN